ncbi:MAG: FAD-binding oxidoreductase [Bacteroidales bacterium]|nr:FAD-binding oxidoreductase [Bacteroidales bacterium]
MLAQLKSFDGNENYLANIERPGKYSELFSLINSGKFIPRGAGLSYCLASAGSKVTSIHTVLFNRILDFNRIDGIITVESGLNLGDFLSFIIPEGWFFPVLPGYPKITIGGCIGFNVHGKSQYNIGLFGDYVKSLKLFHPAYGEIVCSEEENKEIFYLTIGGFGLTGLITEVELKLIPLHGRCIKQSKINVQNLSEAVDFMVKRHENYYSMYSWHNINLYGKNFGKGIIYAETFYECDPAKSAKKVKYNSITSDTRGKFKIGLFNNLTSGIESRVFLTKERLGNKSLIIPLEKASFPINGKEIYFKLFGRKGLMEYQMIIPFNNWPKFEKDFYTIIKASRLKFTLCSLKLFKGEHKYLNFTGSGICMAIDRIAGKKTELFYAQLDKLVVDNEGIANISKDGRLRSGQIKDMYPGYHDFKNKLVKFEGVNSLHSYLRERLEL